MNLESMPSLPFHIQEDGYLPVEWQNFFLINTQNLQLYLANVGHLVPSRSNSDIIQLSEAGLIDNTLFRARSLYNNDTNNFMGNINGLYLNYTMNELSNRASILGMSPSPLAIQYFGDENHNLYSNVNGSTKQIPQLLNPNVGIFNFQLDDAGNPYSVINGVVNQIPELTTSNLGTLNFKIDSSNNLYATINGTDYQVTLT